MNAQGAGDQGMMFGYACDETPDLMPLPIWLAHRLAQRLAQVRAAGELSYSRPDGKTQVSVVYEDDKPVALDTVLISTQHEARNRSRQRFLLPDLTRARHRAAAPREPRHSGVRILANPTGRFEFGGPGGHRSHRPQDHRRHLWRNGPPRRRRILRQGPVRRWTAPASYAARWVAKHVVAQG